MEKALIVAAARLQDGQGCLQSVRALQARIRRLGCSIRELHIAPLAAGWHTPLDDNHFRSGCAPIEALQAARSSIMRGEEAVLIRGDDPLKTGYRPEQRRELMAIYGDELPITDAYTRLAERFMARHNLNPRLFTQLAEQLFENYRSTYLAALERGCAPFPLPDARWFKPVTPLFRGVDCANPVVDFQGEVLLCSSSLVRRLGLPSAQCVEVRGVGVGFLEADGPSQLDRIAGYAHLREAVALVASQSGVDLAEAFLARRAALETYTCYPVVPMAFLLASRIVDWLEEIPALLSRYAVTVTGGMNLARGAWNNPALNGLIAMYHHLMEGDAELGVVHGNGGLGYRQGVALLGR